MPSASPTDSFTASRLTRGNLLFPTRIVVTPEHVLRIKPKLVGVACPKPGCGGELSERRTKRGKTFYGCLKYPDCDFVTWNKPVPEQCPQCGSPYLLEKSTKKEGLVHYCNEETCDYKIPVEAEGVAALLHRGHSSASCRANRGARASSSCLK